MPITKAEGKKNGKQKYRVRVNYTDNTGKAHQIERTAYGMEEAKEIESALLYQVKNEGAPASKTVVELYNEFKAVKKHEVRETSFKKITEHIDKYIIPFVGDKRIDKLTTPILQQWKLSVEECKARNSENKLSETFKKNVFGDFRALLNYAVRMEYLNRNPLNNISNFKDPYATKKKIDYYTADEFAKFINAARISAEMAEKRNNTFEWHYYVFFCIAFFTGLRKGEIHALKWTDIDNDNILHVSRSIAQKLKGEDRETPPKNKSSVRSLQLPEPLIQILSEHKKRCMQLDGFTEDWRICGCEKSLRDSTINNKNKSYAEAAGIKSIRIHDFRHSHASLLANEGINIQEIARRLGHSKIEITWNTYSHLYPREEERAVNILNKITL